MTGSARLASLACRGRRCEPPLPVPAAHRRRTRATGPHFVSADNNGAVKRRASSIAARKTAPLLSPAGVSIRPTCAGLQMGAGPPLFRRRSVRRSSRGCGGGGAGRPVHGACTCRGDLCWSRVSPDLGRPARRLSGRAARRCSDPVRHDGRAVFRAAIKEAAGSGGYRVAAGIWLFVGNVPPRISVGACGRPLCTILHHCSRSSGRCPLKSGLA